MIPRVLSHCSMTLSFDYQISHQGEVILIERTPSHEQKSGEVGRKPPRLQSPIQGNLIFGSSPGGVEEDSFHLPFPGMRTIRIGGLGVTWGSSTSRPIKLDACLT